ncbi:hypothetical protein Hamer_G019466 [Homarus americanus]|uniref:Uncharacterized protein n=1 Tax=Homarus americanus TaxID=6706 RepID=A0A8J5MNX3_HOMAM|nr:hypothetical protein Hamer_G019466 [Homarus americanus]
MQWTRYLLLTLVLLQALTEAKRRKNNNRARENRRNQLQSDRTRNTETGMMDEPQPPREVTEVPHHRGEHQRSNHHHRSSQQQQEQHHQSNFQLPLEEEYDPLPSEQIYCQSCYQLQMRKNLRLAQIKDRVLTATGLLTPPNMTGVVISQNPNIQGIIEEMRTSVPQTAYMQEPPYNDDEPESKTEKMFSPVEPGNNYSSHSGNS